jgi:hypothetical protein
MKTLLEEEVRIKFIEESCDVLKFRQGLLLHIWILIQKLLKIHVGPKTSSLLLIGDTPVVSNMVLPVREALPETFI